MQQQQKYHAGFYCTQYSALSESIKCQFDDHLSDPLCDYHINNGFVRYFDLKLELKFCLVLSSVDQKSDYK